MATARDFSDSRSHENAVADVHGVTGGAALVGTTTVQTLTNKTLTSPVINGATFDNIGPLVALTGFTPTLRANGTPLGGTPATINAGRFQKIGRWANITIETVGNAGMTIPGGDASTITWGMPANLVPRAQSTNVFQSIGRTIFNFGLGSAFGVAVSPFNDSNISLFSDPATPFTGTDLKNGVVVSITMGFECAT